MNFIIHFALKTSYILNKAFHMVCVKDFRTLPFKGLVSTRFNFIFERN